MRRRYALDDAASRWINDVPTAHRFAPAAPHRSIGASQPTTGVGGDHT